jgi:outer membrane protein OmpA-like peptidoglycan-associated protein
MARRLDRIILLGGLATVAACIEVAPRSSVPFHQARDREIRYAAEVTLAVKEVRRDAFSEAAVNARSVLPQMPEIWGVPRPRRQASTAGAPPLALLDPPPPDPTSSSCQPGHCERPVQVAELARAPLLGAAIAPAAAPPGTDRGASAAPYRFQLYFGPGSSAMDAAAQRVLEGAVGGALMLRPVRIVVAGHTDQSGRAPHNERLAQRRAAAVVSALIRAGIPPGLIETTALGERAPAVRTSDGIAHRHNRRVEIILG